MAKSKAVTLRVYYSREDFERPVARCEDCGGAGAARDEITGQGIACPGCGGEGKREGAPIGGKLIDTRRYPDGIPGSLDWVPDPDAKGYGKGPGSAGGHYRYEWEPA